MKQITFPVLLVLALTGCPPSSYRISYDAKSFALTSEQATCVIEAVRAEKKTAEGYKEWARNLTGVDGVWEPSVPSLKRDLLALLKNPNTAIVQVRYKTGSIGVSVNVSRREKGVEYRYSHEAHLRKDQGESAVLEAASQQMSALNALIEKKCSLSALTHSLEVDRNY